MQEGGRAKVETPHTEASGQDHKPDQPGAKRYALLAILVATFLADQATKGWALGNLSGERHIAVLGEIFQLRLVRNSGSAFGLFARFPLVIFALNLVIMTAVAVWAFRTPEAAVPLGLVLGGGFGNLADRMFRAPGMGLGEVVDFLYLSFWPTFNIADSAIVIGVLLLLLDGFREQAQ